MFFCYIKIKEEHMNINKLFLGSISFVTGMLMLVFPLQAKVEGDKIILGSAISQPESMQQTDCMPREAMTLQLNESIQWAGLTLVEKATC